ncbi:MAG: DUF2147 domain-containing protein [Micavibrio aeruginosavorus]|uniref:DUF2147 domain-containing protein n=1 Tax=Micavibrio aeruginosavorus TaxID=349221 RepID=A0A2W5HBC3_9BACT|nr:MAG: DUF2147 domain-containing protein [Micavibrio aeruginosavorus]
MKYLLALLLTIFSTSYAMAQEVTDPTGLWLTENKRSVIEIKKCPQGLCGNIHWIIQGGMQTDSKNPNEAKRNTPMCGLPILWGFTQNPKNLKVWESGKIYKADEGDVYNATVSVIDANKLYLRGYVGIPLLGKTQYWTRVAAKDYPGCKN